VKYRRIALRNFGLQPIQNRSQTNLAAGPGVAIREALLKTGEADYLLLAGGKAIATVEAKAEGYTLTGDLD
jgi:type I restriction enzyme R subunit